MVLVLVRRVVPPFFSVRLRGRQAGYIVDLALGPLLLLDLWYFSGEAWRGMLLLSASCDCSFLTPRGVRILVLLVFPHHEAFDNDLANANALLSVPVEASAGLHRCVHDWLRRPSNKRHLEDK